MYSPKPDSLSQTIQTYIETIAEGMEEAKEVANIERITYERLKMHMDNELGNVSEKLKHLANEWNLNAFWKQFTIAVENAYVNTCHLDEEKSRNIRGHGKAAIKKKEANTAGMCHT